MRHAVGMPSLYVYHDLYGWNTISVGWKLPNAYKSWPLPTELKESVSWAIFEEMDFLNIYDVI